METDLLDMKDAAKVVSTRTSSSAVWRWCRKGVLARNGQRIYLEHWRYGRKLYTKTSALDAFAKAIADADQETSIKLSNGDFKLANRRDERQRCADVEAAKKRLQAEGF